MLSRLLSGSRCISKLVGAIAVSVFVAASASAAPIVFTASGTAASDGRPENGKATITFGSLTSMTITLENTAGVGQLGGISSVLDGFALTFPSAPTGITLTGVTVGGSPTATTAPVVVAASLLRRAPAPSAGP